MAKPKIKKIPEGIFMWRIFVDGSCEDECNGTYTDALDIANAYLEEAEPGIIISIYKLTDYLHTFKDTTHVKV